MFRSRQHRLAGQRSEQEDRRRSGRRPGQSGRLERNAHRHRNSDHNAQELEQLKCVAFFQFVLYFLLLKSTATIQCSLFCSF